MLTPLSMARLPTPLVHLERTSERLGLDVWVKRDDLSGFGLSGNKVRKLEYLLAEAREQGATAVITTGGIQSNHCRATAVAARQLGLAPHLLLRGTPPERERAASGADALDGNLLLDALLGAEITWTDAAGYARRTEKLEAMRLALADRGVVAAVIPEGGSNAVGALGFVAAGKELADQCAAQGVVPDTVVHATGSGGTLAGLAMAGLEAKVLGVAVCDDRAYFRRKVEEIAAEAQHRFGLDLPPAGSSWDAVEGFKGRGYGLTRPEELRELATLARQEGLLLDPCYTGKAFYALATLAREDRDQLGDTVVFWHTGGAFGLFGRGAELAAALDDHLQRTGVFGPAPT